jgi:hypothetical protein
MSSEDNNYNKTNELFLGYEGQEILGTQHVYFNDELSVFKRRMNSEILDLRGPILTVLKNICVASEGLEDPEVDAYDEYEGTCAVYGWVEVEPDEVDKFHAYISAWLSKKV